MLSPKKRSYDDSRSPKSRKIVHLSPQRSRDPAKPAAIKVIDENLNSQLASQTNDKHKQSSSSFKSNKSIRNTNWFKGKVVTSDTEKNFYFIKPLHALPKQFAKGKDIYARKSLLHEVTPELDVG